MSSPSNSNRLAIKFLLTNSLTGSLIGSGGKSIKELMAVTEARVTVSSPENPFPGTSDRVILVSGSKEAVSQTQALIWEMIGLMTKNSDDIRNVEWNPRTTSENRGQHDDVEVSARFTIPAASGGAVLGKGGSSIQRIGNESEAKIAMTSKEEALFTQERIITVSGTVAQCIRCTDMVLDKICDQEEIPAFANRGTTYSSPISSSLGFDGGKSPRTPREGRGEGRGEGRSPRTPGSGKSAPAAAAPAAAANGAVADTTITISIPDELVGNIFGKQGATMREIISLSGAKVVVSARGEYVAGTTNRIVTITGSPTAAQTAHLFITQRLQVR